MPVFKIASLETPCPWEPASRIASTCVTCAPPRACPLFTNQVSVRHSQPSTVALRLFLCVSPVRRQLCPCRPNARNRRRPATLSPSHKRPETGSQPRWQPHTARSPSARTVKYATRSWETSLRRVCSQNRKAISQSGGFTCTIFLTEVTMASSNDRVTWRSNPTGHERTHTAQNPHACSMCEKKFNTKIGATRRTIGSVKSALSCKG